MGRLNISELKNIPKSILKKLFNLKDIKDVNKIVNKSIIN